MCGIAGAIKFRLPFETIRDRMIHRGPDEQNKFEEGNVSFYHLRLSILDISGGCQPMHLHDRFTIIFNGQIYNHDELRKQYGLHGKTYSDTETLLLLYEKFGEGMLDILDGMFVFAIYDKQNDTIFLARDRAGKKPLYIFNDGKKVVFASELNALKAVLPLEMDTANFPHYFRLGVFYRQFTPYKYVKEMEAGTWIRFHCTTLGKTSARWWNIHDHYLQKNNDDLEAALLKTDSILHTAVRRRLASSDLEVGCFLSGGIDSGLTTAVASEYTGKLKTFTVSFPGAYNEAPLAKLVAQQYATLHTEISLSFDHLRDEVEQIIMNYGEPFFDSSAIPSFYVSREAKKHLTVILNGDGADELFGGYRRYVPFAKYDFFVKPSVVTAAAGALSAILPPPADKKARYNFFYRLANLASKKGVEIYFSAGLDIFEGYEKYLLHKESEDIALIQQDFHKISSSPISGLKKIMNMDFDTNLFSDLLVKMDIATMANSLEGRSPFLSKDFLEYVPGLNDDLKINGTTTKFLLRNLAKKYLPASLIHQPKRGFEIPLKDWVNGELREIIGDYLNSPSALHPSFVDKKFTESLLNSRKRVPAEKRAKMLWTLFCMEVWYKKVYLA